MIFKGSGEKNRRESARRGQISMEYLIIIALSLAVLVPTSYFFYSYSKTSNENAIRSQIEQIGNAILISSESVYGLADGSTISPEFYYPDNIRDMYIVNDKEVVIRYELSTGMTEAIFFSKTPLSGPFDFTNGRATPQPLCVSLPCENSTMTNVTLQPGSHKLKFESKTRYVLISGVTQ